MRRNSLILRMTGDAFEMLRERYL